MKLQKVLLFLAGIGLSSTGTLGQISKQLRPRGPVSPVDDPFYEPPQGFEEESPGTILKRRTLSNDSIAAFSALPQNLAGVYQYLYRTTNSLDEPTATVTTLLVPHNANTSRLVSYQVAEDAAFIECAPSYTLRKGAGLEGVNSQAELLLMDALLGRGYYVNTPDYEGPNSTFTAGKMAGHGVLDSIRAVLSTTKETQLEKNAVTQMMGYSGGALASGWAAQLQPSYASDLTISGAALGGTPVNLNGTINASNKSPYCGLIPTGIMSLAKVYQDFGDYINSILVPETKEDMESVYSQCLPESVIRFVNKDIGDYFTDPNYLSNPLSTKVMEENRMGQMGAPTIPLFMYHAHRDEIVPYEYANEMVQDVWCNDDHASIEWVEDKGLLANHVTLAITGSANAFNFLIDRFEGVAPQKGCTRRTTYASALDPGAISTFGEAIWDMLGALLHIPIGPENAF